MIPGVPFFPAIWRIGTGVAESFTTSGQRGQREQDGNDFEYAHGSLSQRTQISRMTPCCDLPNQGTNARERSGRGDLKSHVQGDTVPWVWKLLQGAGDG